MEALLEEGKRLKYINSNLNISYIYYDSMDNVIMSKTKNGEYKEFNFDSLDMYRGFYEFEEYQEPEQIKEYTIQELEEKLNEKIKIVGDK